MNINKVVEIINQKGYEATTQEIVKGSAIKIGIQIGTGTIRSVIYPDIYDGCTDEQIAEKVIQIYEKRIEPNIDISKLLEFEYIKQNMLVALRRPMKDDAFCKPYLDMELVLRIQVKEMQNATFVVKNDLAKQLNLDESIFDVAIKNMKFSCKTMREVLGFMDVDIPDVGLYVISNNTNIFGGSALYDIEYIKNVADILSSDLVIIPSSAHEIIVLKNDGNAQNQQELNMLIGDVNQKQVPDEDQISDHAYFYHRDTHTITY